MSDLPKSHSSSEPGVSSGASPRVPNSHHKLHWDSPPVTPLFFLQVREARYYMDTELNYPEPVGLLRVWPRVLWL